jgi:hypothetical protein
MRSLLCAALAVLCGCASVFKGPTADFHESVRSAHASLLPLAAAPYELCRLHYRLEFLQRRLDGALPPQMLPSELGKKWFLAPQPLQGDAGLREDACAAQWRAGRALKGALESLEQWSAALALLAASGDVDGSALQSAAGDAGSAATALGASDALSGAVKGLGDPLQQLASIAATRWADKKVEEALRSSGPAVEALVARLEGVADLTLIELSAAQTGVLAVVGSQALAPALRGRQPGDPPDVAGLLAAYSFAAAEVDRLEAAQRQLLAYKDALASLGAAVAGLQKAAAREGGKEQREALSLAMQRTHDLVAGLAGVAAAFGGK